MNRKWMVVFISLVMVFGSVGFVSADPRVNAWGVKLPADAVDADKQVLTLPCPQNKHMDIAGDFYEASIVCGALYLNESLLQLDENMRVIPGVAKTWERDGDTWTFHLRKTNWSDGSPVTAHDFEYGFKRHMDPATGSHLTWFYTPMKNAKAVSSGKLPTSQLGVKALDDYTLELKTEGEVLYFDQIMAYPASVPAPKKMIEKYGDTWSVNPESHISNGPWKMTKYEHLVEIVFEPNTYYTGIYKPYLEKIIYKPTEKPVSPFRALQAGEVDGCTCDMGSTPITSAEFAYAMKNEKMKKEMHPYADFWTRYLYYNLDTKPWNDIRVREAFTRAIDGDIMVKVVYAGQGTRAYGMLPPGFPAFEKGSCEEYQSYDPEKARKLLAEAGYPGGKGFPTVTLWHKTYEESLGKTAQIVQQMLKKNLGISIMLKPVESKFFNSSQAEGMIDFGLLNWGFDFIDASNFLTVWSPEFNGKHKRYQSPEYMGLIRKASNWPNPKERNEMYTKANQTLSKDHAGTFLYHRGVHQVWKPYVKGLKQTEAGHQRVNYWWIGMSHVYIAKH